MRARSTIITGQSWWLVPLFIVFQALALIPRVQAARNITIGNTSPEVVYTPFLCDVTGADCEGAWRVVDVDGISVVTTDGPSPAQGSVIPQMFIRFRASAFFMTTSSLSSALANFTLSAGGTVITQPINTSIPLLGGVNLIEADTTQLTITFISGGRLDIGTFNLTVSDDNLPLSSVLPSVTLPPSMPPPTFTIAPTSSNGPSVSPSASGSPGVHPNLIAQAVGLTVGLGLGLTVFVILAFMCFRLRRRQRQQQRRRSRRTDSAGEEDQFHSEKTPQ
ncbi:hypothetical protein PLEOSDRAFT_1089758 [Pleurotus ostreatus PC15]|uniref:Mid2 domain-containing protein n=1 Tax=Pleurotus ostreatus (strain PC15) TaxID=1137138 RepID=A0A067NHI9_PLEO1|nr:hypothetical protein PLEOSDRAFT_1089758 [Pleurotus ostreatus PC15]